MDGKHTPGPWTVSEIDYPKGLDISFEIVGSDGLVVGMTIMREKGGGWRGSIIATDRANVHLMASAPELAEAGHALADRECRYEGNNIVIPCGSHGEAIKLMADLRAALAKAISVPQGISE